MLVDTHCHINIMVKKEFDCPLQNNYEADAQTIIEQANQSGVTQIVNVGTSVPESKNCITIAQSFTNCWATIGTHPNDLQASWIDDITLYENLLQKKETYKIVGIGEIGLDYHYPNYDKERQYEGFKKQIKLAIKYNLPIVIHTRDAGQEVLEIIETYNRPPRGIIHCFSEDMSFAERAIDSAFVLGIGGPLTYPKNTELQTIFKTVPLEKIVLETDAPFLPPQSIRGKKNSPLHIKTVADFLADLRGISFEEVAQQTTETARTLFGLPMAE